MSNIKENDLTMSERDLTGTKHPIVEQMEMEWPEMTGEFRRLQREQYELFCRKQHDYGPGNISVGTQLQTKEEIHLSLTGLWFRMNDKIQRLKTLLTVVIYQEFLIKSSFYFPSPQFFYLIQHNYYD